MTSDRPDKSSGAAGGRTPDELVSQVRFLEAEVSDLRRRLNEAPSGSRGLELRLAAAQRSLAAVTSQNEPPPPPRPPTPPPPRRVLAERAARADAARGPRPDHEAQGGGRPAGPAPRRF